MRAVRLFILCALIAIGAFEGHPRAQGPAAAFYAIGDLPGGGATTIIRDATRSGGVIYAVGGAVTRLLACPPLAQPCAGQDTPILWRFDGIGPATLEALPDISVNTAGTSVVLNGASDISADGRYIANQARITGGPPRAARVDTTLLPGAGANVDLNTTFAPALTVGTNALATSSDGTILYGFGQFPGPVNRAIRFDTAGATSEIIPTLGGDTTNNVAARGTSADGSVVVGFSFGSGVARAYRYEHGVGVAAIPMLPGSTASVALAVSPDGDLVLVSGSTGATTSEVYLYRASTDAIQPLGSPSLASRTGGRLCANSICNPTIQVQGGMTADGSVVAMNFTNAAGPPESGHASIRNAHGWFPLASVLAANGVYIAADGWQDLLITGISSDGTLVFGGGDHNGVFEGFVASFAAGALANFNPQAAPPISTALVGVWGFCDTIDPTCDLNEVNTGLGGAVVFTADGAYYEIEDSGFERGFYTYDGTTLRITTLLDTNGNDGLSGANGMSIGPLIVDGDTIMPGGPLEGIRIPGSSAEPLVGAWVSGNPTLPGSSFVAVLLPASRGYKMLQASDGLFGVGSEVGTYTWDPGTQVLFYTPSGGVTDPGSLVSPSADGLTLHVVDIGGLGEFDAARVIDPATIPVIANTPLSASGVVGQAFNYDVDATNTATFTATGMPNGLSIDSGTGVISGTPAVGGQFLVTVFATSTVGVSDIETLTLTVAIPTLVGQNVVVQPQVPAGQGPVTVTFGEVTSAGETTVTVVDPSQVPPIGNGTVAIGGVVYEVQTTATFTGLVELCFSYAGINFGTATPRLFHFENGAWVDITTSVDPNTQTICGATTTLSPFAVLVSHVVRTGFRAPVNPIVGFLNTVKGGATVPLKFNVYIDGIEKKTTDGLQFSVQTISCDSSAPQDPVDFTVAGDTNLRYDSAAGYFIQNWKVPNTAGCYMVRMTTAQDGLALTARFKAR